TRRSHAELKSEMAMWGLGSSSEVLVGALTNLHFYKLGRLQNTFLGLEEVRDSRFWQSETVLQDDWAQPSVLRLSEISFAQTHMMLSLDELEALSQREVGAIRVWRDQNGQVWSFDSADLVALALRGDQQHVEVTWSLVPDTWPGVWSSGSTIQLHLEEHDAFVLVANQTDWLPLQSEGLVDGNAIIPNEFKHQLISKALSHLDSGVLLSVGSFRVLHSMLQAKFDEVFVVDIDQAIKAFGELNQQLILMSESRNDYLVRLLAGRTANAEEGQLSFEQLVLQMRSVDRGRLLNRHKRMGIVMPPSLWQALEQVAYARLISSLVDGSRHPYNSLSCFQLYSHNGGLASSIFHSNPAFELIRRQLETSKLKHSTNSIVSPETLSEFSDYLETSGQRLAAIDFSNALWHVARYSGGSKQGFEQLYRSLLSLPFHEQARIALTTKGGYGNELPQATREDHWTYYAVPVAQFMSVFGESLQAGADADGVMRELDQRLLPWEVQ
ncbi:MAG: hypothetical protein HRT45_14355, partial [Bdellovibrionales bacterium]|nr:hypothetical protein [Bdellovibrionales bacterium]